DPVRGGQLVDHVDDPVQSRGGVTGRCVPAGGGDHRPIDVDHTAQDLGSTDVNANGQRHDSLMLSWGPGAGGGRAGHFGFAFLAGVFLAADFLADRAVEAGGSAPVVSERVAPAGGSVGIGTAF